MNEVFAAQYREALEYISNEAELGEWRMSCAGSVETWLTAEWERIAALGTAKHRAALHGRFGR